MEYFKKLNINASSSKDDIKKAYIKLILKHHPDKGGNKKTFISIKDAYDKLLILNSTLKKPSQSKTYSQSNPPKSITQLFQFQTPFGLMKNSIINKRIGFNIDLDTKLQTFNLRQIISGTLLSYIALRHLLPKKEITIDKYNSVGDKLVGHTHINCILFHKITKWYDDDNMIYKSNSYYWRRTKILYNDTDRNLIIDTERNIK
jgi:curved DNA-binding protein CbpA